MGITLGLTPITGQGGEVVGKNQSQGNRVDDMAIEFFQLFAAVETRYSGWVRPLGLRGGVEAVEVVNDDCESFFPLLLEFGVSFVEEFFVDGLQDAVGAGFKILPELRSQFGRVFSFSSNFSNAYR